MGSMVKNMMIFTGVEILGEISEETRLLYDYFDAGPFYSFKPVSR